MLAVATVLYSIWIFFKSLIVPTLYIEGVVGPVRSIYPPQSTTDAEKTIVSLVYRGLYKYDDKGNLVSDLAKTVEVGDDGLSYTVTISENNFWHNGDPITADDVLYSASLYSSLSEIRIDRVSDTAVKFILPNKFSPFLSILTFPLVSSKDSNKVSDLYVNGSGDFRVIKVSRTKDGVSQIVLFHQKQASLYTSNPAYKLNKIAFRVYKSDTDLQTAYKLGEIDGFFARQEFNFHGMHKISTPIYGRYFVLHFNTSKEPFSDKDLRKKLAKSIDLDYLQKTLLKDKVVKTDGVISNSWVTKKDLASLDYDPNQSPETTVVKSSLSYSNSKELSLVANYIVQEAKKLNLEIELNPLTPAEINNLISTERDYDLILLGEEVGHDPDRYVFWHSTQQQYPGLNLSQFSNIRVDKALEKGREETDPEQRLEHYSIFQTVINEEVPALFLYHEVYYYNMSDKIKAPLIDDLYYPWERLRDFVKWEYQMSGMGAE
ncbi:ABC transporter substrate-binding protein [Candidatus Parcubacteria bacterium]|nr:ABC transporter substrate-binding protein [Patescibacteria group bacterium]MCG2688895.1 ABC transporter substrate-binding protein [Candidatus Parcubacteria bacterium]